MEQIEEKVQILVSLPAEFSYQLDRMLIDFKEAGIKMSKATLMIKLARIGYNQENK